MKNKYYKFILVSENGYDKCHDKLLESLLDEKYELFCAVGKDCELWEDIMDEIAVGDATNPRFIVTTSHPYETLEEVIDFATSFRTEETSEIKIVYV